MIERNYIFEALGVPVYNRWNFSFKTLNELKQEEGGKWKVRNLSTNPFPASFLNRVFVLNIGGTIMKCALINCRIRFRRWRWHSSRFKTFCSSCFWHVRYYRSNCSKYVSFTVQSIDTNIIADQIAAVFEDISVDAQNKKCLAQVVIETVVEQLRRFKPTNLVVDPVAIAMSGHRPF